MKKLTLLVNCLLCSCMCLTALAAKSENDSPPSTTKPLSIIASRVDNLESYTENLSYILDHLERNVVMFQVIPLSKPHTHFEEIGHFVQTAITESLNFQPDSFDYGLSKTAEYFTSEGFIKFKNMLTENGIYGKTNIKTITGHAVLLGRPVVTDAYVEKRSFMSDRIRPLYTWDVDLPMFIETEHDGSKEKTQKLIHAKVIRASIEYSAEQILIDDIQITDYKAGA